MEARRGLSSAPRPPTVCASVNSETSIGHSGEPEISVNTSSMSAAWWDAPVASVVVRPEATDAGETSASGSFGCDVRDAGGHRKRGAPPPGRSPNLIASTESSPSRAVDASAADVEAGGAGAASAVLPMKRLNSKHFDTTVVLRKISSKDEGSMQQQQQTEQTAEVQVGAAADSKI